MPTISRFEDIIAWQKGRELTRLVYRHLKDCRDYAYKDQVQRASISVMSNIAEGFERGGNKELKHYLFIAKGSAAEIRSLSIAGYDIGYLTQDQHQELSALAEEIARILSNFIKTL